MMVQMVLEMTCQFVEEEEVEVKEVEAEVVDQTKATSEDHNLKMKMAQCNH